VTGWRALEQDLSVFMISWKNPDASMAAVTFEDYMTDDPRASWENLLATGWPAMEFQCRLNAEWGDNRNG